MREPVTGKLAVAGQIDTQEPDGEVQHHKIALLIEFDSADDIRQAIADGVCKFRLGE